MGLLVQPNQPEPSLELLKLNAWCCKRRMPIIWTIKIVIGFTRPVMQCYHKRLFKTGFVIKQLDTLTKTTFSFAVPNQPLIVTCIHWVAIAIFMILRNTWTWQEWLYIILGIKQKAPSYTGWTYNVKFNSIYMAHNSNREILV